MEAGERGYPEGERLGIRDCEALWADGGGPGDALRAGGEASYKASNAPTCPRMVILSFGRILVFCIEGGRQHGVHPKEEVH